MAVPKDHARRLRQALSLARRDALLSEEDGGPDGFGSLWASMGRRGLLGWSVPAAFGGEGARYAEMLSAMDGFVRAGGRPGLALSWAVHLIVAKTLIAECGTGRQRREILPAMASGKQTVSIALSEPEAGNDPKGIRTRAVRSGDRYVLDGEKTWLTNGPLADFFLVFAVTARRNGRKSFSARRTLPVLSSETCRRRVSWSLHGTAPSGSSDAPCPPPPCSAARAGPGRISRSPSARPRTCSSPGPSWEGSSGC